MEKISYEDAIKELNEIIDKIESNTVSMEESIEIFERGTFLINNCYKQLNKAKGKLTEIKETIKGLEEI